jgi:Tol biopolymer transport system component
MLSPYRDCGIDSLPARVFGTRQSDGGLETRRRVVAMGLIAPASVAWSPDGERIAVAGFPPRPTTHQAVEVIPAGGGEPLAIWSGSSVAFASVSSPDGTKLARSINDGNEFSVVVVNRDGTSPVTLAPSLGDEESPSWSGDGARILFASTETVGPASPKAIYVIRPDGTDLHRVVNGTVYRAPWNRVARPGKNDGLAAQAGIAVIRRADRSQ